MKAIFQNTTMRFTAGILCKLSTLLLVFKYKKYIDERDRFQQQLKGSVGDLVRNLKPKQFYYAFPAFNTENEYSKEGWTNSETLKTDFQITSNLTNWIVFLATYTNQFSRPYEYREYPIEWDGTTFEPSVVEHGDDPFLFTGGNDIDDKVILDTNTEAYGMGGDDLLKVVPFHGSNKTGSVKVDGGEGSDTIYTTMAYEGTECFVTGGGPERDTIGGGKGNDFVLVENDMVYDWGGENTFLVTGSGDDIIEAGPGVSVIIINKTSGSIDVDHGVGCWNDVWKSRRIIYQGDALTSQGNLNPGKVKLSGSYAHHDVLKMTNYHPLSLSSGPSARMIVLLHDFTGFPSSYNMAKFYFDEIDDVADFCSRTLDV